MAKLKELTASYYQELSHALKNRCDVQLELGLTSWKLFCGVYELPLIGQQGLPHSSWYTDPKPCFPPTSSTIHREFPPTMKKQLTRPDSYLWT
jgi:hypothetical protein